MSEMVEIVARAMWNHRMAVALEIGTELDAWENESEGLQADVRAEARLAIAAMRKPTEVMLVGACDWSIVEYSRPLHFSAATGFWHAMIDAALKE